MKNQKENNNITRRDLVDILDKKFQDNQKSLLKHIDRKLKDSQESMAIIVNNSTQATQDLLLEKMNQRFDAVDEKFREVTKQINKINLNAVDVVRQEEFEKLGGRVVKLEEKLV